MERGEAIRNGDMPYLLLPIASVGAESQSGHSIWQECIDLPRQFGPIQDGERNVSRVTRCIQQKGNG
jgi:hypothetical protein